LKLEARAKFVKRRDAQDDYGTDEEWQTALGQKDVQGNAATGARARGIKAIPAPPLSSFGITGFVVLETEVFREPA
jgi:hypothetical protein